jgi:hypothetical protein
MSTLAELCSDLLLDPLPPARKRNPAVPHAPVRNHRLNPTEQKVFFYLFILIIISYFSLIYLYRVINLFLSVVCRAFVMVPMIEFAM